MKVDAYYLFDESLRSPSKPFLAQKRPEFAPDSTGKTLRVCLAWFQVRMGLIRADERPQPRVKFQQDF